MTLIFRVKKKCLKANTVHRINEKLTYENTLDRRRTQSPVAKIECMNLKLHCLNSYKPIVQLTL